MYIMRGCSGSGKSTGARKIQAETGGTIVSRDIIRQMLGAEGKTVLDNEGERRVTKIERELIRNALYRGESVIVDNMNLDDRQTAKYADLAHLQGVAYHEFWVYASLEKCIERRAGEIPEKVIRRQWNKAYGAPFESRRRSLEAHVRVPLMTPVVQDESLPPVIVFDIDGTLADSSGLRSPYDYSKVSGDRVIRATSEVALALENRYWDLSGVNETVPSVVFVSGRDEECRAETLHWIQSFYHADIELYMRGHGDDRHDAVVKREILERDLIPQYHVLGAFDDRLRVLDMWRASGIFTFSVNQREEDF